MGARDPPSGSLWVPAEAVIVLEVDDSTQKKAGRQIDGGAAYRTGAGSARQEYRTLRGLNFVWGIMRVPLGWWPGHWISIPIGLSLYLKQAQARKLKWPYRSRSALARESVDLVAVELPTRAPRVIGDGGYATKEYLQDQPPIVEVVSRMLITGKLYKPPRSPRKPLRGRPPQKGAFLGSPQTLARKRRGWQSHPTEAGALVQAWEGLWHTVLPGRLLRVVVVRRLATNRKYKRGQRKPLPRIEAFFTTDLSLSLEAILEQYRDRWAVEIMLRDSYAFDGIGHDQCRKVERIVGVNTLRVVLAAARPLWFLTQVRQTGGLPLTRCRPWYRRKSAPSQRDSVWTCREALAAAGVFPIPRFTPELIENPAEPENTLPLAA